MSESAQGVPAAASRWIVWGLSRDEQLADRAAAGDDRAFEALFKRYHQPLYRYCRAILTDSEDAEDAMQATMVKALRALPGERREVALRPWLYRVAHNESISILRSRRETTELEPGELAAPTTIEQTIETRDRIRGLVSDLAALPERQRAGLVMRELSDLSYEEIGAALATSPAAAKQTVYEARTALLEMAEGREMDCTATREAISAGDRRVLRGRRLRAHLRSCERCRDFEAAIGERRDAFAALAPPLAAPAALAILHGALGGGSAGAAGAGAAGTLGAGLAGGAAVKTAVAVIAVAAIGGGAAATGVLDRDQGDRGNAREPAAPADQPAPGTDAGEPSAASPATAPAGGQQDRARGDGGGDQGRGGRHQGRQGSQPPGSSQSPTPGNSAQAPGQTGAAPGQSVSAEAPGQTGSAPGQSGAAPGQGGAPPGQTGTAPGQAGTAPGQAHSNAGGGGAATAPGQTGTAPGSSADAPGQRLADRAEPARTARATPPATPPHRARPTTRS